jgi:uncharacterized protein (DUF608 family)
MSDFPQPRKTGRAVPFSDDELFDFDPQEPKTGEYLNEIAFPLGGIGSGCISLSGRGELVDWEIFNRPNKGYRPDHTYFVLHAKPADGEPVFRVMEGRLQPPYQGWAHGAQQFRGFGFGPPFVFGAGFLRFAGCSFTGDFPFCTVSLSDDTVPVSVDIEAWSPFIPLDDEASSLPVAIFSITVRNTTDEPVDATVALGLQNIVGWPEIGGGRIEYIDEGPYRGLVMTTEKHAEDSPRYGAMALLTPDDDTTYQLRCEIGGNFGPTESLMDGFGNTGLFNGPTDPRVAGDGAADVGHLGLQAQLKPGASARRTFVLSWMMPNFELYWGANQGQTWRTYHANTWGDAVAVGEHTITNMASLWRRSRTFADTFDASTVPSYVKEAISSQAAILRTPTVTRLPDGTVHGFEGCHASAGCCPGSCTHVWTYAQTIASLFPGLERGMREIDFATDLREDGHMQFRMPLPPGTKADHGFHAAADGQMGNVLRTYREWQICGDDAWLQKMWPSVKRALEYAWVDWDADRDGLLEGVHHNTLDIEYHGPDTVCGSMYLAALRAGEEMARYLGDDEAADEYRRVFESGSNLSDEQLYDGEYYFQEIPEGVDAPYQYGHGCIVDQVLGQWHARMYGLGNIYDIEHVRSALSSVYRYNFRDDFYAHHNPHRVYALNDDRGLLICTWPKGGRPERSVYYAFECMIGFEYQVGAHLIYEGFLREGLSVCKAVRDRHDGYRRNPYNEFECGSHYSRSMANYSYLLALSGFRYSAPTRTLYFEPVLLEDEFCCFFSVDRAWGSITRATTERGNSIAISVTEGELALDAIVYNGERVGCPGTLIGAGTQWEIPVG